MLNVTEIQGKNYFSAERTQPRTRRINLGHTSTLTNYMKSLYSAILFLFFASSASAQCTPNLGNFAPGVYPENLIDGCVNANYSQQLDLVFQADTSLTSPFPVTVPFDSIQISVSGLPAGLSHECPTTSCTLVPVPGQIPRACMLINGLPTTTTPSNNTFDIDIVYWITLFGSPQAFNETKTVGLAINNEVNAEVNNSGSILTAQSGSGTFQWTDCDNGFAIIEGETQASFEPSVSGNYAVAVTVGDCVALSECFSVTLSVPNYVNPHNFQLFPIPAYDQVTLEIPNFKGTFAISLVDVSGRIVYESTVSTAKTNFDLSSLSKGVYTIRLAQQGVFSFQKLIVE